MRVWQLIDARAIGGIERHVATVTMALRRRGYAAEIVLLQRYDPSPWLRQLELDAIPYRTLDGHVSGLVKAMREEPPALVHTHGYKANILGRLVARALGIPVVSSFHAGETPAFPVSLYTRIDAACSGLATRIAVSQAIADQLPQPTQVVRNFVAVPQQAPREALPQRVGFIGRLSHEKGPDLFCEMAEQGPPGIEWHVWGDGPMRIELEARYARRVTFHGLSLDIRTALGSIGLLCMPSRAEGLPMAALEAMAAGVPVLAARVGGLPGLVHQDVTGWLFAPGNIAEAAAHVAVWQGLSSEARSALRIASHESALERFSEAAVLPQILKIYGEAGLDTARTTTTHQSKAAPKELRDTSAARRSPSS